MSAYDLSDTQVVALIRNSHTPTEIAADGSAMDARPIAPVTPRVLTMICARDYEPWPCSAARELRALDVAAAAAVNKAGVRPQGVQNGNRTPIPTAADQAIAASRRG